MPRTTTWFGGRRRVPGDVDSTGGAVGSFTGGETSAVAKAMADKLEGRLGRFLG